MADPGMLVRGRGSWFGGPRDSMDSGATALGLTTATPGVAVRPGATYMSGRATLGGYWRVRAPNGRVAIIRQTDIGPNQSTGRRIDVTYSALRQLGYTEANFPTDGGFSARYLGKRKPAGGAAYGRPQGTPTAAAPRERTVTVPDQDARQQALRNYLAVRGKPGALLDLAHGMDATTTRTLTTPAPVKVRPSAPARTAPGASYKGYDTLGRGPGKVAYGGGPSLRHPTITSALSAIAGLAGGLTVGTTTDHSKYTVSGNVSDHYSGNAADIPATGARLTQLGQAALIALGVPRNQAHKMRGGLYNVQHRGHRYQVIFNTHEGGDHTTHLHVGVR